MNYIIVIGGWAIGMMILIVVSCIWVQQSKKYECGFAEAFKIYTTKDKGPLLLSAVMLVAAIFILPDIIVSANLIQDGKIPTDTIKAKAINAIIHNMRVYSILFGIVAQGLGFLIVSKAGRWLNKVGDLTDQKIDNLK